MRISLVIICITILSINILTAQAYKISVINSKEGKLTLVDFPGQLPIEGYSGNEIIIVSDYFDKIPAKAQGLKPIYPGGIDNTGLGFNFEKNDNHITLRYLLPPYQKAKFKIQIPDNFSIKIENECGTSGDVSITKIKNEIEIKNCKAVSLNDVTGPLILSTRTGDIQVEFSKLDTNKPTSIVSVDGNIDVSLPISLGVNLDLKTISGSVYSDFELPINDKDRSLKHTRGAKIITQLNGGGANLKIINISGNIFLRKAR